MNTEHEARKSRHGEYRKYRESRLAASRKHRLANTDAINATRRTTYQVNRDQVLEQRRVQYQKDRQTRPEHLRSMRRRWKQANPDRVKASNDRYRLQVRMAALAFYGGSCACCGETEPKFLAIDHIGGGGTQHRRTTKITEMARWLKQHQYPPGFRVVCHNCNLARGFYGACPHEATRAASKG